MEQNKCMVCGSEFVADGGLEAMKAQARASRLLMQYIPCSNCGPFIIDDILSKADWGHLTDRQRARISHSIRKMRQYSGKTPEIGSKLWHELLKSDSALPSPAQQANNLILWLGQELGERGHGEYLPIDVKRHRAVLGALNGAEVDFVRDSLLEEGLIAESPLRDDQTKPDVRLTFKGWDRFEELRRSTKNSRKAFMAMRFGKRDLQDFYEKHFKPAVAETGFDLQKLDEAPKAGIIDVRMEVEIRSSRFVVADLTHCNNGVYWEAGFASGLDKPVFYTCREDKTKRIHFDTRNRLHIAWDLANPQEAVEKLKAAILATLPTEAKWPNE